MAVWPLDLIFTDVDGKEGKTRLYLNYDGAINGLDPLVALAGSSIAPLSDCALGRAEIRRVLYTTGEGSGEAQPGSSSYRRLFLVFRQGQVFGSIQVPSPRKVLFDGSGNLAGIRVSRNTPGVLAIISGIEAIASELCLPWGDPFPTTFSVGGRNGVE